MLLNYITLGIILIAYKPKILAIRKAKAGNSVSVKVFLDYR